MSFEPNQWRVLTINEDGVDVGFYVFRNPPNATFCTGEGGEREVFTRRDVAQALADGLNEAAAMPRNN